MFPFRMKAKPAAEIEVYSISMFDPRLSITRASPPPERGKSTAKRSAGGRDRHPIPSLSEGSEEIAAASRQRPPSWSGQREAQSPPSNRPHFDIRRGTRT